MARHVIFRPDGSVSGPFDDIDGHDGVAVEVPDDFSWRTYAADMAAKTIAPTLEPLWADLRVDRDRRLAACDWTQLADVPPETREAWQPYRQALRDMPETADPFAPEWPTPPG